MNSKGAPYLGPAPVVVFGSFARHDWGLLRQRQHNMVEWLAATNEVLYVERLGATVMGPRRLASALVKRITWPDIAERGRASSFGVQNLNWVRSGVIPLHGIGWADRINSALVLRRLRRAVAPHSLSECAAFVFYPSPYVWGCVSRGGFKLVAHDAAHRYGLVPEIYGRKAGRIDADIAMLADVRSCDSYALQGDRQRAGLSCTRMPQGVSARFAEPEDLQSAHAVLAALRDLRSQGRLAGFVGAISDVLDASRINSFAEAYEGRVVIVGPVLAPSIGVIDERVQHLGAVPGELVPSVMRLLDVGLIPYVVDARTEAVLPTKLVEYVASSCRVVSTPLREALAFSDQYPGTTVIAESADEWRSAGAEAASWDRIPESTAQSVATQFSWSEVLRPYGQILESTWSRKRVTP